ncbi:hypothetical protein Trydic_g7563 [Trypoxylus dichotomus]
MAFVRIRKADVTILSLSIKRRLANLTSSEDTASSALVVPKSNSTKCRENVLHATTRKDIFQLKSNYLLMLSIIEVDLYQLNKIPTNTWFCDNSK